MTTALAVLVRDAFGDDARIVDRRAALYRSGAPVEEVTIVTGDGHERRLAAKQATRREIDAYHLVLSRLGLGTPAFVGARGDLLLLEWVDGIPLWQSGDLADWEAAARWLAALHALSVGAGLPPALFRASDAVLRRPAAARLARAPAVLVHGEFFPANVLVCDGLIRPLDFETLGLGAAAMDVAALTAGDWPGDEPARIEAAYRAALPDHLQPTQRDLDDARLLVAEQCREAAA